jgi:hypothetical protein
MKTAMQELIDNLESIDINIPNGVKLIFIEKEKEQIQKAFSDGQETPINHPTLPHYSREEYYSDNYNIL